MSKRPLIMVSAGEASSDHHAAHALDALNRKGVEWDAFGMGASQLEALGVEISVDCRDLAVIGFVDVLMNYMELRRRVERLRALMRSRKPDLLFIVDYPDFNLKLGETARELGIPVLFYISPQVWAWRSERVHKIGKCINHMAVIFPFEEKFYTAANVPVTYVGHPLIDTAHCELNQAEARASLSLTPAKHLVALLPGSRNGELSRILPIMLDSAKELLKTLPQTEFVIPCAPTLSQDKIDAVVKQSGLPATVVTGQTCMVLRAADAALTASGTATLETALIGTPMAIVYRVNKLNYAIMSRMIKIDDIGLVNIVAGKRVVQEFIQHDAKALPIAAEVQKLLTNEPYRKTMQEQLANVRQQMGQGGASDNVAALIAEFIQK